MIISPWRMKSGAYVAYLEIQAVRYDTIPDYEIDIDEEIKKLQYAQTCCMPLLENALYHGLKAKRRRGMIL